MVETKNIFIVALLGLFLSTTANFAHAATIIATVDRQNVNEGESLQLTLEIKGDADGNPDFRPLEKSFEIINRNKSNSMQIINGRITSKSALVLTLMPKRKGDIIIPPIAFGKDRSNAIKIVVSKGQSSQTSHAAKDVFLQVSVDPRQTYVQAQVIYTIQVYISTNVANASLSEPKLSDADADAVIEKLGEDRRFEKEHRGRRYQVVERRYAIFPQQSGKLTIDPVVFDAQLVQASRYMMNPFPQQGQTRRIQSKAIELTIKAIPASQKGKTWLPARNLRLEEKWPQDPPKFKVGEAVTRTLTIGADGLTAAQLPEIATNTPAEFKVYPDQPSLNDQKKDNGVIGIRQEKIAMIATKPGHYVLPEVKISWWNTKTQRQEIARLAKRKIQVVAADGSPRSNTGKPGETPADKLTIATTPATSSKENTVAGYWPWLSLTLATGWLATLFIMWRQRNNTPASSNTPDHKAKQVYESRKQAEKKIKQACMENNAKAAKEAMLIWARVLYPEKNLNSLSEIGKQLGGAVADNIITLNQTLYSSSINDWQGQGLWDSIQEYNTAQKNTRPQKSDTLTPLYP